MSERRPSHLRWWKELTYIVAFYLVYSFIRNQFGSESVSPATAFRHAEIVRTIERALGSFHEETIQEWFLGWKWFIQLWNIFYGTFHFVVTAFCIFWLFKRFPERYVTYRTTLACTTALALIGFATFPLMPPRLIPEWGFVDTLKEYGGLWSFDSGAMQKVSNQYAAMPSLHFGWSTWCAMVLVPTLRRPWLKALAAIYPALTLFAIVVTGNHFWLDAAGGALILAVGYAMGAWWARRSEDRVRPVDDDRVTGVVAGGG
ncbi:MAG TPA: phosphatase PAP2 family protein [Acidimicrobiales bacterium]|nr:phosphatase PAP2 family protein [Acidimicrobiales bacterium]